MMKVLVAVISIACCACQRTGSGPSATAGSEPTSDPIAGSGGEQATNTDDEASPYVEVLYLTFREFMVTQASRNACLLGTLAEVVEPDPSSFAPGERPVTMFRFGEVQDICHPESTHPWSEEWFSAYRNNDGTFPHCSSREECLHVGASVFTIASADRRSTAHCTRTGLCTSSPGWHGRLWDLKQAGIRTSVQHPSRVIHEDAVLSLDGFQRSVERVVGARVAGERCAADTCSGNQECFYGEECAVIARIGTLRSTEAQPPPRDGGHGTSIVDAGL